MGSKSDILIASASASLSREQVLRSQGYAPTRESEQSPKAAFSLYVKMILACFDGMETVDKTKLPAVYDEQLDPQILIDGANAVLNLELRDIIEIIKNAASF